MRILYLADIRFPLERANGIQSMETCHALATRGHEVTLVVRPDTYVPPRDPFDFYGLAPLPQAAEHPEQAADYAEHTDHGAAERTDHADQEAAEHADYADQGAAEHADRADRGAAEPADHADRGAAEHADCADRGAAEPADRADRGAAEHADHADRGAAEPADRADRGAAEHADRAEGSGGGSLKIEVAPVSGPPVSRRAGYLTFALGRAIGRTRQDLIFTRDLGLASLLLRLPAAWRAPLVYEAHTIAADEAAARTMMLTGAAQPSPSKLRRLARRDRRVWSAADGYVTITAGLARELERRYGPRPRIAVVPDGVRATEATEISATDHADNKSATDHADHADNKSATDHADHADNKSATDHADHADKDNKSATDRTDHADNKSATDHADHAGRTSDCGPLALDVRPPTSDLRPPTFTIGYAGHLYPWKGVDLIVEAVTALPDTRALIVGGHDQEPDLERVKALAEQLGCASRVSFTGLLPPPQVAARLREADVLVLPNPASAVSSEFTSPLKLFEYMAAGRPIVASDLPSIREVLTHEKNALLVEPGQPQALTAAIRRLKEDAALGARLAAQARQDVRAFTWARRAERLEALFAEVCVPCRRADSSTDGAKAGGVPAE